MSRKHGKLQNIGKRPHSTFGRPKKIKKRDVIAAMLRHTKRDFIARGIIQDPANRPLRYKYTWTYGSLHGIVYADDRSTARAFIKRDLGIRKKYRLPVEVEIVREDNIEEDDNEDDTAGGAGEDSNCDYRRAKACAVV